MQKGKEEVTGNHQHSEILEIRVIGIEPRGGRGRESDLGSERYENTVRKNGNSGRATSEFAASSLLALEAPVVGTGITGRGACPAGGRFRLVAERDQECS